MFLVQRGTHNRGEDLLETWSPGHFPPTPSLQHQDLFCSAPGPCVLVLWHMVRWAVAGSSCQGSLGRGYVSSSLTVLGPGQLQGSSHEWMLIYWREPAFELQTQYVHFPDWVPESSFHTELCQSVRRCQRAPCLKHWLGKEFPGSWFRGWG